MFDSLVDFLKTNIDELNGHEVRISSEFKEHHNEDSKYIIKNWLFSSPEYRKWRITCLLYTSPSPRDLSTSRMPSSA